MGQAAKKPYRRNYYYLLALGWLISLEYWNSDWNATKRATSVFLGFRSKGITEINRLRYEGQPERKKILASIEKSIK